MLAAWPWLNLSFTCCSFPTPLKYPSESSRANQQEHPSHMLWSIWNATVSRNKTSLQFLPTKAPDQILIYPLLDGYLGCVCFISSSVTLHCTPQPPARPSGENWGLTSPCHPPPTSSTGVTQGTVIPHCGPPQSFTYTGMTRSSKNKLFLRLLSALPFAQHTHCHHCQAVLHILKPAQTNSYSTRSCFIEALYLLRRSPVPESAEPWKSLFILDSPTST